MRDIALYVYQHDALFLGIGLGLLAVLSIGITVILQRPFEPADEPGSDEPTTLGDKIGETAVFGFLATMLAAALCGILYALPAGALYDSGHLATVEDTYGVQLDTLPRDVEDITVDGEVQTCTLREHGRALFCLPSDGAMVELNHR